MTNLTQKEVDIEEGLSASATRICFEKVKKLFISAPLLLHFDFSNRRFLHVDSSGYAWSAVFSQPNDQNKLQLVAYFSKKIKMAPNEVKWQVHNQELGAIIQLFNEWRTWLTGTDEDVQVWSNHANLKYFMESKALPLQQAQWVSFLSMLKFKIHQIAGKLNPADAPSRREDYSDKDKTPREVVVFTKISENKTDLPIPNLSVVDDNVQIATMEKPDVWSDPNLWNQPIK